MKKIIFIFGIAFLMTGTVLTSCQSSATKVENAMDKVELAQQELNQTIKDSIRQFKKASEAKIQVYEQNIAEFKARIAKENNEARGRDERKLADLEQQNREMKQTLAEFNEAQRDQWLSFREKFNRDMERQQRAFKDFWGIKK